MHHSKWILIYVTTEFSNKEKTKMVISRGELSQSILGPPKFAEIIQQRNTPHKPTQKEFLFYESALGYINKQ